MSDLSACAEVAIERAIGAVYDKARVLTAPDEPVLRDDLRTMFLSYCESVFDRTLPTPWRSPPGPPHHRPTRKGARSPAR
jgi:hypothetical protein